MGCGCLYSRDTKKLAEISSNQVKNRNVLLVKDLKEVTLYFHNYKNSKVLCPSGADFEGETKQQNDLTLFNIMIGLAS